MLKLCPRLFLFHLSLSLSPPTPFPPSVFPSLLALPSLRSIIVEHRSRRARYKCPSLSGSRNPQQLPSCLAILARRPYPLPRPFPFFRSRPKLNTLESERLNLSAITRSFPSSSIKASQDGSRRFERTFERRLIPGIDGTNISAESVTARVCVSVDGNSPLFTAGQDEAEEKETSGASGESMYEIAKGRRTRDRE